MASRPNPQKIPAVDYIDSEITEQSMGYHEGVLFIFRDMLLTSEDDRNAAPNATRLVREYYHDKSLEDGCPWENDEDHAIPWFLVMAADIALEVAAHVPISDFRHDRVVDFLTGFKEQATHSFDPKDPQLTWIQNAYSDAIVEHGKHAFSSQSAIFRTTANEDEAKKICEERINFSSVGARLLARDLLTPAEVEHFAQEIIDGLEWCKWDKQPSQLLLLDFRAVIAARHLILAAEAFAWEAKNPKTARGADRLSVNRWKAWVSKLKDLATSEPSDSPWPVKDLAGEALERIGEVYPGVVAGV